MKMRPLYVNLIKDALRKTIGSTARAFRPAPSRFVIISGGRSGSNLLVALLNQNQNIRVHSEIFGEYQLEDFAMRHRINRRGATQYFYDAFRPIAFEASVGLKVLYYQIEERYGHVRGIPGVHAVKDIMQSEPELKFIHLKRNDLMALLVSGALAKKTSTWVGGSYNLGQIEIDPEEAFRALEAYSARMEYFTNILPVDRTMNLTYEDISDNPTLEVERVCTFLGVRPHKPRLVVRKQTEKAHREYVANYGELCRYFSGTRYADYFEN